MNLDTQLNSRTTLQQNLSDNNSLFEATTQQFKKYTTIEATRKIKPFFNKLSDQDPSSRPLPQNQLSLQTIATNRQTLFLQKYLPYRHFNPRFKSKKRQIKFFLQPSNPTINKTITIDDNDDQKTTPKQNIPFDNKLVKQNRSLSLKSYLGEKSQQKLILPKIIKTQTIVQIFKQQLKQSMQKLQKQKNPRLKKIKKISLNLDGQNQQSQVGQNKTQVEQNKKSKNPSQRQIFKSIPSKQSLKPLIDLGHTSAYKNRRRIELMGMKLKPVQRNQSKIDKILQNRTQRVSSLNLIPSQLIYKNAKESIEKSVYQQLIKRVFNSN